MIQLRAAGGTHVGRNPGRTNNEDRYLTRDGLWAVADGVGGHAGGEVAAGLAVDLMAEEFRPGAEYPLVAVIERANRAIWERASSDPGLHGMATTITAVARREPTDQKPTDQKPTDQEQSDQEPPDQEQLIVANVGDSRTYLLRNGELTRLTVDHSQVEDMVRDGMISREEAARHPYRHIVTRVLGIEPEVEVDHWAVTPGPGDRFLLCSDGLIDEVTEAEVTDILRDGADPQATVDRLIATALDHGGSDNVTVVVVDVVGDTGRAGGDGVATAAPPAAAPEAPSEAAPAAPPGAGPVAGADDWERRDITGVLPAVGRGRRPRWLTLRVVIFVLAVLVVLGGASAAVIWYGRASYYVGLQGNQITIFKGRPGGFLWFRPTLAQRTPYTTAQVTGGVADDLQAGVLQGSLSAADQYVLKQVNNYSSDTPLSTTTTTTTTTTTPPVTASSVAP